MEFSWIAWLLSVAAVVVSGALAWWQGHFQRRATLDMGFTNHGGMWGDLVLLPIANAAIVPHLTHGWWIAASFAFALALSCWAHVHWYRGARPGAHSREHMWPTRRHGSWWKDLSWAGWAHVLYVTGELTLLSGFFLFPMPRAVVVVVCVVVTLHVPLGLLQPRWFLTGKVAGPRTQPLLVPLLAALWTICLGKL